MRKSYTTIPQRYLTRSTFLGLVESPTSHCTRVRYRELSDTRSVPLTAMVLSGPAADREQSGPGTADAGDEVPATPLQCPCTLSTESQEPFHQSLKSPFRVAGAGPRSK